MSSPPPLRHAPLLLALSVLGALTAGCDSGTTPAQRAAATPSSAASTADPVRAMCERALPDRVLVSAAATTVGVIREHRIGPGVGPAEHAFAGHPAQAEGAWCWAVRPADASLPEGGTTAYGVGPGQSPGQPEAVAFVSVGAGSTGGQTSGAPIVP